MKTGILMTCSKAYATCGDMVSIPMGVEPHAQKFCPTIAEAVAFLDYCKANFDGFSCWPSVSKSRKPRGYDAIAHTLRFDKV